jgi:hypothetical protein
MTPLLTFHIAVTWMIIGLIWVVQILVYPQFLRVGELEFKDYHFAHCFRIGLIVGPLLFLEAATAAWLLYLGQHDFPFLISLGLILANWISTAAIQAPMHTKLMKGFNAKTIRLLILSNWIRTFAWTARGVLVSFYLTMV